MYSKERIIRKNGRNIYRAVIANVHLSDSGECLTNHLWIYGARLFKTLGVKVGDLVVFDATVDSYIKGLKAKTNKPISIDYSLSKPSNIHVCKKKVG